MKVDLTIFAIFLIIAFLMGSAVTCNCNNKEPIVKTVRKTDTVYKSVPFDVPTYVPQPYAVVQLKDKIVRITDTKTNYFSVDTAAILKDYYASVYYKDSISTQYGKVFINDTVTQNRIAARSVQTRFVIPEITTTITNTVQAKKKNEVWLGLGGHYNGQAYAGGSVMFLHKKGLGIEAGAAYGTDKRVMYSAGIKKKLSFKK